MIICIKIDSDLLSQERQEREMGDISPLKKWECSANIYTTFVKTVISRLKPAAAAVAATVWIRRNGSRKPSLRLISCLPVALLESEDDFCGPCFKSHVIKS